MKKKRYRIYADENAPPGWGVQAVVYEDKQVGWTMAVGGDYYIERADRWVAVDLSGLLDYVVNELGIVMVGRTVDNATFKRIYQQAKADRDFASKSGYLPGERRP